MKDVLIKLRNDLDLENAKFWNVPTWERMIFPEDCTENFERNVYLRENMRELLDKDAASGTFDAHFWVTNTWGGTGFRKNDKNKKIMSRWVDQIESGNGFRAESPLIPSYSKIAAFYEPHVYAIYDSRVIYTLNWLIYSQTDDRQLFKQPDGRKWIFTKRSTETLYALCRDIEFSRNRWNARTSYEEYCAFLRKLADDAFGKEDPMYMIEMLLFHAAEEWTPENVRKSVAISFNFSRGADGGAG